jgi:endonuclease/exonuclease/phosphatase family metal-dependent hydrolase
VERKLAYVMLIVLPIGYFNFFTTFAIRKEIPWRTQKDTTTLRVMTWNAQGFSNSLHRKQSAYRTNREEILATIRSYDPDVICFQEYRNIENAKKRISVRLQMYSLGYKYSLCSNDKTGNPPKNTKIRINVGVAIFSKLPLLDSARFNVNHSTKDENFIYTDILFNNKPVRIFTAHLQSFAIYTDTTQPKFEDDNIYEITYKKRKAAQYKLRETEVNHQEEVEIIRKVIDASNYPVIYCGDLNTTPASYNYRYLKGNNLQDAFLKKGYGIGNTFYKIGPTLRIDVCLTDTAFEVEQCMRVRKKISDHFPVIADVKWKSLDQK